MVVLIISITIIAILSFFSFVCFHVAPLPQVEPCFRVGDNRDSILLGLVHSLGGRLSCASVHDMKAGAGAAHGVGQGRAPPARLLDRHVCRSPALLRAGVAAGVRLYEVGARRAHAPC